MPLVGSSKKTTDGQPMKAMATLSLRRWPPDRSPAATPSFSARPGMIKSMFHTLCFLYELQQGQQRSSEMRMLARLLQCFQDAPQGCLLAWAECICECIAHDCN